MHSGIDLTVFVKIVLLFFVFFWHFFWFAQNANILDYCFNWSCNAFELQGIVIAFIMKDTCNFGQKGILESRIIMGYLEYPNNQPEDPSNHLNH